VEGERNEAREFGRTPSGSLEVVRLEACENDGTREWELGMSVTGEGKAMIGLVGDMVLDLRASGRSQLCDRQQDWPEGVCY
jgi:hypothetical protein